MKIKATHIVIITKIDVHAITSGSADYSPKNTYNKQNYNYQKRASTQQSHTNNGHNCNNNSNSKTISSNFSEESLLFTDVYGKKEEPSSSEQNSFDFSTLLNTFMQNNSNSDSNHKNSESSSMPDIETLLKFKKIFEKINSSSNTKDPLVNLLYAIKPFMQDSKKSVIDQIAKFMTISCILQEFNTFL